MKPRSGPPRPPPGGNHQPIAMEFDMLNKFANTVAALGLASIVAGFALSAHAGETTDMAQFTCGDYLDLAPEDQATVIYWLDGYLSHKTSNLVIDFATLGEYGLEPVDTPAPSCEGRRRSGNRRSTGTWLSAIDRFAAQS